jgi:hypothetical protein
MAIIDKSTIRSALHKVSVIRLSPQALAVEETVALLLIRTCCPNASVISDTAADGRPEVGTLKIRVNGKVNIDALGVRDKNIPKDREWLYVMLDENGTGYLISSGKRFLYMLGYYLVNDLSSQPLDLIQNGKIIPVTFSRHRPYYDHFVNQHARSVKYLDHDEYFENLARIGFSHAEVNGIAFPVQYESGPKGEVLHRFYTYAHALDQFVCSKLNKDIYKSDYLSANLNYLKKNASYAAKYGLAPGLVCFEPRSVPEALLQRYPMLRGARVDHPLRSFQPRYNLSIAHPVVREHYAEMMEKLMREVPTLDYMSIWSNDSGAGFEYTNSLYVGRNGGGYVIREWKGDREIAEAAALNIVRFLKLLRDAGRKVNPDFRVVLRFDPFWAERDYIMEHLEEGLDIECVSLTSQGMKLNYIHPKYADVPEIQYTALHNNFYGEEKPRIEKFKARKIDTDIIYAPDVLWNHEPLTGIPYPCLIYEKLSALADGEVASLCHSGGVTPPSYVPKNINQEVLRAFQLNRGVTLDDVLNEQAVRWVGEEQTPEVVSLWKLADETFRFYPVPIWIYTSTGVWYRLLIRPLVPDIEAIPEGDRAYYEDFLLATPHNRARVDFRYDVGFELTDSRKAYAAVERMDRDLFPMLDKTIGVSENLSANATSAGAKDYLGALTERFRAWRCWLRNQRNIAAWVAGVHGYLESNDPDEKKKWRKLLNDMVLDEIENTRQLLELWDTTDKRWMYYSDTGETTFIYGENFGECLREKIRLMQGRENDEPYIDPDFQWRVPDIPWSYKNGYHSGL